MTEQSGKEIPKIMSKEQLVALAKQVEQSCYYPNGRRSSDGAMYTALGIDINEFVIAAEMFFGDGNPRVGYNKIRELIETRRRNGEQRADPYCGNWELWTILNELGVSRVKV